VCETLGRWPRILDDRTCWRIRDEPDIKSFDASCFDGKYVTGGIDEELPVTTLEQQGTWGMRAPKSTKVTV
jgi:hypothetical protein